jgi:NAD(P)H-hydrate epimerase
MTDTDLQSFITDLLQEAGHHHHAAYLEAEGVDPEWALWYAGYMQTKLWDRTGTLPTRSRLVYLLVEADRAHAASGSDEAWPPFYARRILADLS